MFRINEMYKIFLIIILFCVLNFHSMASNYSDHRIAVLVNDQLITSYDIVQRMKMNAILNGINITPENNDQFVNSVIDELIKEKLKNEKIKEYDIVITNDEYLTYEDNFYQNIKLDKNIIIEIFKTNSVKYNELENFLIYELSWQKLVSQMYYRLTSTSEIEINEILNKNKNITKEIAENMVIQKQLDLKSSKMIRDMMNEATIEYK